VIGRDAAGRSDAVPPAADGPGGQCQPGQFLTGQLGAGPEIGGQLGNRLVYGGQPTLTDRDHSGTSGNLAGR